MAEPRPAAVIMEAEIKARKERAAVTLERKMGENVMMKASWCQQLKLASRYLGLRPAKMSTGNESYTKMMSNLITTEAGPSSTESQQQQAIFLAIEISKSAPGEQNKKRKRITEIGISTLATSDLLVGRARGETYVEMDRFKKKIRTRNFRIKEWSNLQETDLILGCEDNFKKEWGNSEWISVHNAPKLIASCFGHDASSNPANISRLGHPSSSSDSVDDNNNNIPPPTNKSNHGTIIPEEGKRRNIIIVVGHRVEKKISDLKDIIGFDVTKLGNVIKAIDVQDMFRALQQNPKARTLHSLFQELDKPIQTNPNPGNDSNYTLQAMIHICLKSCDAKYRSQMAQERILRMKEKASQTVEDFRQELAEWDRVEGDDDDDGGEPVPIKEFLSSRKEKK